MKQLFWFFVAFQLLLVATSTFGKKTDLVAAAIAQVVRDYFMTRSEHFDFVVIGFETEKLRKIVSEVMKATKVIARVIHTEKSRMMIDQSAVLLFDSVESHQEFVAAKKLYSNKYPKDFHFLVYIQGLKKLEQSFGAFRHGSYILHQDSKSKLSDDSLKLVTYEFYKQPDCNEAYLTKINQFSRITRTWKKREYFIEKFNNFNGCELNIRVFNTPQAFDVKSYNNETLKTIGGYGVTFNEQISRSLNYTYFYNVKMDNKKSHNKTLIRDFDLNVNSLRMMKLLDPKKKWFSTEPFMAVDDIILISKALVYTQFEKIFLPFQIEVWHWMIATLVIAVLAIVVFKLTPKLVQNFVFGSKVQTPILNLM